MIPNELRQLTDSYFEQHKSGYNFEEVDECGQYIEALVAYAQNHGYPKVGLLKYTGGGTKYNNHRIDSFLYNEPYDSTNPLLQSCDVIANAETDHASAGWSLDEPRYTEADWMHSVEDDTDNPSGKVPWVPYNEQGFERCKKMIKHDYERRPQGPDYDVSVWSARFFHNHYMGPFGVPLNEDEALMRVKDELCAALKIPNDGYLGE